MRRRKRAEHDRPEPAAADRQATAGSGDFAALGPEFTARIDAILDDVRGEADRILNEARRKAAGTTTDIDEALAYRRRRLLDLYETLIARAELVVARLDEVDAGRDSLDRMVRALNQAADQLTLEVDAGGRPEQQVAAAPQPDRPAGREAAVQMAAAGATRRQVEAHLLEFSILGDPAPVLDEVFGPGSGGDARVPWAIAPDDSAQRG